MFDPVTRELIQSAPPLSNLDVDRLPEQLTRFYSVLVALRLQQASDKTSGSPELLEGLEKLPRLAHAYGATALVLNRGDHRRRSAAFVAATAYRLIEAAKSQRLIPANESKFPTAASLPDWITSSLLFLAGGYTSDAFEIANRMNLDPSPDDPSLSILVRSLRALILGRLHEVVAEGELPFDTTGPPDGDPDLESQAVSRTWNRLHRALRSLAMGLLGISGEVIPPWETDLKWVIDATTSQLQTIARHRRYRVASVFPGPHHLARLLEGAAGELWEHATVRLPPPTGVRADAWHSFLCSVADEKPFLWPNHLRAVATGYLDKGKSVLLTAPTGAGKSLLIELKVAAAMLRGMTTLYLVPTRALVDQVRCDLDKRLRAISPGARVSQSLIDGNYYAEVDNVDASVLVMTPERALTILAFDAAALSNLGLLVFDECHLLHGEQPVPNTRAVDSMLCLTRLLERADGDLDVLLSSAMVKNAHELAGWVSEAYGLNVVSLTERWKPTRQVRGCLIYRAAAVESLKVAVNTGWRNAVNATPPSELKRQMELDPYCIFSLKQTWQTIESEDYAVLPLGGGQMRLGISGRRPGNWRLAANRNENAARLAASLAQEGVATIVFADQPKNSVSIARSAARSFGPSNHYDLSPEEQELHRCSVLEVGDAAAVYGTYGDAAGVHHGLMIATERKMVELLFRRGAIKLIAATPTLAQGMNLPAEAVVLAGDDRYDELRGTRQLLRAHEMLNAIGRAGRAGHVSTGFVVLVPGELITYSDNDDETTIGRRWFDLKDEILGQEDNCIDVTDPIQRCMDLVLIEGSDNPQLANYFLRRLPPEQDIEAFLQRTLAAYHARMSGEAAGFAERAASIRTRRQQLDAREAVDEETLALSFDTGMPVDLLSDLSCSLPDAGTPWDVRGWVGWLKDWCDRFPQHLSGAIGSQGMRQIGILIDERSEESVRSATSRIFGAVDRWVSGEPLTEIERCFLLQRRSVHLDAARRFVIQMIPRISFMFGLITLCYRRLHEVDDVEDTVRSTTLACLGACVREGFDSPRKLALYHAVRGKRYTSRVPIHSHFRSLLSRDELSDDDSVSFDIMLQEARSAISEEAEGTGSWGSENS